MSLDLARRLLSTGAVQSKELALAIFVSVVRGVPMVRALLDRGLITERALETDLSHRAGPAHEALAADVELIRKLPVGLCRVLSVVPLDLDSDGRWRFAAVDPTCSHVENELEFQTGGPVTLVRASQGTIEYALGLALGTVQEANPFGKSNRTTPAFPHGAPATIPPPPSSDEPPIPLVRRGGAGASMAPTARPSTLPPILGPTPVSFPSIPPVALSLSSDRPLSGPPGAFDEGPPTEVRTWTPTLPELFERISFARDRDELLELVLRAVTLVAHRAAVFVVRREGFCGWLCNPAFGSEEELRKVVLPASAPSILATSATAGFYLGPIPRTPVHLPLIAVMGRATSDVAVYVSKIKSRPAVVVLADELDDTLLGTRALGDLSRRAGDALSVILGQSLARR